ncbi:TolC family outer membrane protein [Variovorax sp. J22P168]|uniref:TolC family outer membrane protein n=1 Tax=Variovorax jilinensis TaxID=3053513 RepID=UPI002574B5B8|nr:TolC family outer membrane protein [Variovorax sp. J22P168]MDM0011779.1 TolC family outer membrane protein [Variovorax sp. J22P168]
MPVLRPTPLSAALATLFVATLALPAHGQSLIQLYDAARGYDATYQGARAQYDASLARAAQAKAGILPAVGLSGNATATHQELSADSVSLTRGIPTQAAGVNATQPLYRPANWATYEQSKRQVDIAGDVLRIAEQDLVVRVSQAYFDVLSSQDTLALVRQQKLGVAEQLASAKRNFEVGTSTITDTREAQARFDLVLAQEIAAENDLQVKKIALDLLVGQPNSQPVPLAAPVVLPVVQPADMNAWVTQAEDTHPAIEQARLGVEVARLEVEKAQAGHKPTLDAQLGYNVTNNPNGSTTSTTTGKVRVNAASIAVVFNMPLFAGFATENRIKETLALEEQQRQQLESTRRSVSQATRTAYLGLVSGAGQVKALEAAEASSQSALEANRLGYEVGVRINIDVLNSQSQLFQTRRDLAVARYNVLVGNLRLRQANGTLTAADLEAVNATLALGGRANVQSEASPTRPSAATQSPVPVPPPVLPSPAGTSAIPVVPPVVTPPFSPQAPAMPVPPPPPVIEQLPQRTR